MTSYYSTPRRRHSSLFERMQNEIKKISKKLSAAKQSYKGSTSKPKNSHFSSYNSIQDRNPPTVRKYPQPNQTTQPLNSSLKPNLNPNPTLNIKQNTIYLKRKQNSHFPKTSSIDLSQNFFQKTSPHFTPPTHSPSHPNPLNSHTNPSSSPSPALNRIILHLQSENTMLSHRLGKIEQICQDQSYKLGYMKAELKETNRELDLQRQKQFKENCYLTCLMEYYKKKANKYRKLLKEGGQGQQEGDSAVGDDWGK